MEELLFGKSYGLTHEDMIKAHHSITAIATAIATAKKTPYQLDLEVKDRKPDIVPKVGDKVRIKSRAWYEKWKDENGMVDVPYTFIEKMSMYCGKIMTIRSVFSGFYLQEDDGTYTWSRDMFEEVYPQESSKEVKCSKAFESLGINGSALEKQLTATSVIPAINPVQGIGISYDLGTLSRQGAGLEAWPDTSPRTTLPQSCFGRTSAVVYQDFFKKEEPELQTIKKHRFIKLEKL